MSNRPNNGFVTSQLFWDVINDLKQNGGNSAPTLPVYDGLSAQGTTSSSTAVLQYGVNVFTSADTANYAAKLPQPTTGKNVSIVNKTSNIIALYPSNVGGQINNLPIDSPAYIPNDGTSHEFVCIENPLPGAWTWSAPAVGQIVLPLISVAHTNGADTYAYGTGASQLISAVNEWQSAVTASESGGVITLLPAGTYWRTENFPVMISTVKCYSNFIAADGASAPSISRFVVYKPSLSVLNAYTAGGFNLNSPSIVPAGTLNNPVQVGDAGTYYKIIPAPTIQVSPPETDKIGTDTFSSHYYIFGIRIPSNAASNTYDFQIILEYY